MRAFLKSFFDLFTLDMPDRFVQVVCSCFGAFSALVIWHYAKKYSKKPDNEKTSDPVEMLLRFLVSWIAGCFLGPFTNVILGVVLKNITPNMATYLAGFGGYTLLDRYVTKRIESLGDDPVKPPES